MQTQLGQVPGGRLMVSKQYKNVCVGCDTKNAKKAYDLDVDQTGIGMQMSA